MGLRLLVMLVLGVGSATAQEPDRHAAMAVEDAMSGALIEAAHLRLTPARPSSPADSALAMRRVTALRAAIEKYRDSRVAEADGYHIFLPNVPQPVYHFTNTRYGIEAAFVFDPARPTSLLYRRSADGSFELVGAMYTASALASMEQLNERVPLSVAHWHEHVNWCVPPQGALRRWLETEGGLPRFGPKSPVATKAACDAVGGLFLPRIFGWMVHAMLYQGDDPAAIWGTGAGHEHD